MKMSQEHDTSRQSALRKAVCTKPAEEPENELFPSLDCDPVRDPATGHVISPVLAAALCVKPRGMLTASQAEKVDALKRGSQAFAALRRLAMRFRALLRAREPKALDAWIDDAIDTDLIPIMRFARVLRRDVEAVSNAIELPWSNGRDCQEFRVGRP